MKRKPPLCTAEESGAFVVQLRLEPTGQGPLDNTTFAVKDALDIAGQVTGRGSPAWTASHGPAPAHSVAVELLLDAGATCVGKTQTDEMTFGMDGENPFYGTPLNPAAPDRVPGGSSSGSASAVACGLADFALATDTGGSARMPASHCGILGYRPSHDRIPSAGVGGLAPSFDTVGVLAASPVVMEASASVLLGEPTVADPGRACLLIVEDAFDQCEPATRQALLDAAESIAPLFSGGVRRVNLADLAGADFTRCREIFLKLQGLEAWSYHGEWVENAKPEFGQTVAGSFAFIRKAPRESSGLWHSRREAASQTLAASLTDTDVICLPSSPSPAPIKGTMGANKATAEFYRRSLSLTSPAGIGRMPQVSLPLACADGAPVGLSLAARRDRDLFLLAVARRVMEGR